jgi:S1-C subfamily serine protease
LFGPQLHPIPERGGRAASILIAALVGAVVAALVAGSIAIVTDDDPAEVGSGPASPTGAPLSPGSAGGGGRLDIQGILDCAQPSVVSIETGESRSLFGGAGSGFVISNDGLVVTNNHVIEGASEITVRFFDGEEAPAELVGSFPDSDLAMVRVGGSDDRIPARLGSSEALRVGDDVVAIGNALNLGGEPSVTLGIVSGKDRTIEGPGFILDDLIQTDAAINPGNSGGPLLNAACEVVGINTAIIPDAQNIGFAIAVDPIKPRIEDLRAGNGEINPDTAFLGVKTLAVDDPELDPALLDRLGVEADEGALIVEVTPDSGADEGGLVTGDVIVEIDDQAITEPEELGEIIRDHEAGDRLTVTIERRGERRDVEVELGRR